MSWPLSLRRIAASHWLRAAALLAWWLMAVSLPAASAMAGGAQDMRHAHGMTAMAMDHTMPSEAARNIGQHADCCGTPSHSTCHCEALCGSVMLPAVPALFGQLLPSAARVSLRSLEAPTPQLIPPWRPPAARRTA